MRARAGGRFVHCRSLSAVERTNGAIIHSALRLSLESNQALQRIVAMTADIERAEGVDLGLVLKCCLRANGEHLMNEEERTSMIKLLGHIQRANVMENGTDSFKVDLVALYCRCGAVEEALSVLHSMAGGLRERECVHSVMRWLMDNGQSAESVTLCQRWISERPSHHNELTFQLLLRACSDSKRHREGIDCLAANVRLDDVDRHSVEFVNSVIAFYGECGRIEDALCIFRGRSELKRDGVTTNAMMTALSANDRDEAALLLFWGSPPVQRDAFSFSIALRCCGNMASLHRGQRIVDELESVMPSNSDLARNGMVRASVLAMYSRCGHTERAVDYFEAINIAEFEPIDQVPIAKAMMDCYAKSGDVHSVLSLFRTLWNGPHSDLYRRDHAVVSIVLSACSHCGLREEAKLIFDDIKHCKVGRHPHVLSALYDSFSRTDSHEPKRKEESSKRHSPKDFF